MTKHQPEEHSTVRPLNHLASRGAISAEQQRAAEQFKSDVSEARRFRETGRDSFLPAHDRLKRVLAGLGPLRAIVFATCCKGWPPHVWAERQGHKSAEGVMLLRLALTSLVALYGKERLGNP